MGAKTEIEWTDATWNVVRGCLRVSEGCRFCYAEKVAHRFCGEGQPYEGLTVEGKARWNGEVRFEPSHLLDPMRRTEGKRFFVNSVSDVFYERFTNEQIAAQFAVMLLCPQHEFQVLTKRPARMVEWLDWLGAQDVGSALADALEGHLAGVIDLNSPRSSLAKTVRAGLSSLRLMRHDSSAQEAGELPLRWPARNILLGVSVENQKAADERIPLLVSTDPRWRTFLSCEPLLGEVTLKRWLSEEGPELDWIIVGGESGDTSSRPLNPKWVRKLRDECAEAGVPFFFKQWGDWMPDQSNHDKPVDYVGERTGNKKANGALLDGVEHKAWPTITSRA